LVLKDNQRPRTKAEDLVLGCSRQATEKNQLKDPGSNRSCDAVNQLNQLRRQYNEEEEDSVTGTLAGVHRCDQEEYAVKTEVEVDSAGTECKKGKGSRYSITERRIPELIPVLSSQPAGDVSHKHGGRLPLLSARPAVTPATLKRAATNFAPW